MPTWLKRTLITIASVVVVLFAVIVGALLYTNLPSNGAGMAAKAVCSATFVAGREDQPVFEQDVLPASPAFAVISTDTDLETKSVTGKFLGLFERRASLLPDRGCVLDEEPDPAAQPYSPATPDPAQWPEGDATVPKAEWPAGVKAGELESVVDQAFEGAGNPDGVNARGVSVVQDGKMLLAREAENYPEGTALHGWSMTKTVAAMLFYKKAQEIGLDIQTPVVDAFPADRTPEWVAQWREDERAQITVADLLFMRAGLDLDESYQPWGQVVQMLNGEPNMAAWAAEHELSNPPGTFWEYSSAVSNILAQVTQMQFEDDAEYWQDPYTSLFDKIGATSATLETDTFGTWVGSSYLWASVRDWARFGQVMLDDGEWDGEQVIPTGWLELASTPAMPTGEGHGYGAQTWLPGESDGGECADTAGFPKDTVSMEGHWGQIVAMVPSKNAVISRLGWTINSSDFDGCKFVADVAATLPDSSRSRGSN